MAKEASYFNQLLLMKRDSTIFSKTKFSSNKVANIRPLCILQKIFSRPLLKSTCVFIKSHFLLQSGRFDVTYLKK